MIRLTRKGTTIKIAITKLHEGLDFDDLEQELQISIERDIEEATENYWLRTPHEYESKSPMLSCKKCGLTEDRGRHI